ncbi:MAG: MFS transporter [Roseiflexaceae bacterium]
MTSLHSSQSLLSALVHRVERVMLGPMRSDVRYNVWVETIAALLFGIFWAVVVGFMPVILRKMGATESHLAVYVVFMSLGLLFTPVTAFIFQRYNIIKVSTWIWVFGRSMFLLTPFVATNVNLFMVCLGIFWICETVPSPGYVRLLEQLYPDELRGRIMSFVRIGMTLMILLMTPVAGWLLDQVSFVYILPAMSVIGWLASAVFARLRTVTPAPTADQAVNMPRTSRLPLRQIMGEIGRNRPFMVFLALNVLFGCGTLIGSPLYAVVQVNRLEMNYTEVGYLNLVQSITWLLGFFFWGRITDRRGPIWVLVISMLCGAMLPFGFMVAQSAWWLVPAFIGQGLLLGGFDLGFTNTAIAIADRKRLEVYFAAVHMVSGARGILVPLLTPILIAAHVTETAIFAVGGVLIVISAGMAYWIRIPAPQEPHTQGTE